MKSARVAGDILSPLTGLRKFRFHYCEFCNELLPQDTRDAHDNRIQIRIRSSAQHRVGACWQRGKRTREEDKLFRTWVLLIEEYEQRARERKLKKFSPHELLNFLMDENRMNQKGFEPEIPQSRMSNILNGNRPISNAQAVLFGQRFHVKPSIFLGLE